ncbi:MAG TPA: hypothetical protein PKD70_08300 [Saprospiraceae bacterium]|nr:hypothetical protein [Saprospiraceae bacterium]
MPINYWHPFEEGGFYHIYNRSNNKETIFKSDGHYRFFLQRWDHYLSPYVDTFAYALLPNHFHFLVSVRPGNQILEAADKEKTKCGLRFLEGTIELDVLLEDQMKRFLSSYAQAFNKQQDRHGSVFQKRFKRVSIKNESHLMYLIAYLHHNPMHHGLANHYEDWHYTSFKAISSNAPTKICREALLNLWCEADAIQAKKLYFEYHQVFQLDQKMANLILDE